MGKREVRVIVVPKAVTIALLVLVTAAMAALLYFLSGRTYVRDAHPATELLLRLLRRDDPSRAAILVAIMPIFLNVVAYMPWGFLAFIAIDSSKRPRFRSYLFTIVAAAILAAAMSVWQMFLPTRVTSPVDAIANTLGAFVGAIGGHLRKEIHVRFEH